MSGFEAFSAVGDGNTTYYAIVHQTADEWEVGLGTYTAAGTLLSRDTILESSNSDAAVVFSAGTKDVFVTYPSDKAVYADSSDNVGIGTNSPSQKLDVIGNIKGSQSITIGTGGLYEAGSIYSDSNWGMIFRAKQASPGQADFRWANSADTEYMRINSSGNVGIGTSSPDFLLDVAGRIGILEGTNGIAFHDGAGSVSAGVRADSGDNLIFATGS